MTPFICCFGAMCYFICSGHLQQDKANADAEAQKSFDVPDSILNHFPTTVHSPVFGAISPVVIPDVYGESGHESEYDENIDDTANLITPAVKIII